MSDHYAASRNSPIADEFAQFTSGATYYTDMDYVEYIVADQLARSERIDEYLTLLWNRHDDQILGFRIKGFRHLFETRLKATFQLTEAHFVFLVSILEAVVGVLGHELLADDDARASAYRRAFRLAENDNARLYDLPIAA